jgi:vanillate O-demethylase monooxygenase subunit
MHVLDSKATLARWPRNAWYVACTPDEIAEKPLGRQICGERMIFYRSGKQVAALEDFCPHRGAPLSLGFVENGNVVCGYHGLAVDCAGRPAFMPGQDVTKFPPVRAFPVIERYGFIWVWPGEAALADPARLHHLPWAEDPRWTFGGGRYHIACDYRLMIDNLMDLTHETYVHAGSIGQKELDQAPVNTARDGDDVVTSRLLEKIKAPPFWRMALEAIGLPGDAEVDRWQICRFSLPSHIMIEVGVALAGQGGIRAPHAARTSSVVVDFITPETETSHWYFWGLARDFKPKDTALTERIRQGQSKIFAEDLDVLERQQANLLRNPGRRLLKLNIDAGGVHSRLAIERAIAAEGAPPDAPRSAAA